jgi:hypothetical protein
MVAAAATPGVGVAAIPVVVSEVGVLLSLPTVAAFVESPAVFAKLRRVITEGFF